MRERAHMFGSHGGLVGIRSEPDGGPLRGTPTVVFSNVGLNHRVGPNRSWVELARALAEEGYASLRFDLSGLGDSEPRPDERSDSERAALDLTEALDFLGTLSDSRQVVLVGNCSGVDSLHAVANRDPRVVGAVYIDGYAFKNGGYRWRRRLLAPLQPSRWSRYLLRRRVYLKVLRESREMEVWKRDLPSREQFTKDLEGLLARRVRLLFVYTGGMDTAYNYRGQFHDTFGHRDEVDVELYPRADHLLSRVEDRALVVERICRWVATGFPEADSSAGPDPQSARDR
jgi:pimeloyl-ACP methyl ester carboxylesterase